MNLKIKNKITIGVFTLCFLLLVAGLLAIYSIQLLFDASEKVGVINAPRVDAAMEIKLESTTAHLWFEEVMTGEEEKSAIKKVWERLDNATWYANALLQGGKNDEGEFKALENPKAIEKMKEVKEHLAEFKNAAQERFNRKYVLKKKTEDKELDARFDNLFEDFLKNADEAESIIQAEMAVGIKEMYADKKMGMQILISAIIISLLLGIAISYFLSKTINQGINNVVEQIANVSTSVENGDLSVRGDPAKGGIDFNTVISGANKIIDAFAEPNKVFSDYVKVISKGEIPDKITTDYKGDFNAVKVNFNSMIDSLTNFAITCQETSAQVATGSQQMSSSTEELAQSANEQSSSVEEVSSSMEEMNSSVVQNADNAKETASISEKAAADAQKGGDAVLQTVEAMKDIAEKIGVIEEIARQTNMLALNAAIEAARAGNHGKGFAVVASEVRNLAERSGIAANEISELSNSSVDIAENAGNLISNIVPQIQKTAELVQEINAASTEQARGIEQVTEAISQLDTGIQQSSSASEEMASTSEELAERAMQLQQVASFFKLKDNGLQKINKVQTKNETLFSASTRKIEEKTPLPGKDKGVEIKMKDENDFEKF